MKKPMIGLCAVLMLLFTLAGCEKSQAPYLEKAEELLTVALTAPGDQLAEAYASGDESAEEEALQEMFSGLVEEKKIEGFAFSADAEALHRNLWETGAKTEILKIPQVRELEAWPGQYYCTAVVRVSGGRYDGLDFILGCTIRFTKNGLADYMEISGDEYKLLAESE